MGYGFVEFATEEDAEYAIKIMNMIKLYGKPIRVNKAKRDGKTIEVGANLFIGNLDPDVDEKLLYDTFSAFGVIVVTPKVGRYLTATTTTTRLFLLNLVPFLNNFVQIMRDPETGESRGFGFVSYDSFESADAAIEAMNGQYVCNRPITVSYAIKKDSKTGERHGSAAGTLASAHFTLLSCILPFIFINSLSLSLSLCVCVCVCAERMLAANNPNRFVTPSRPHTMFATAPGGPVPGVPFPGGMPGGPPMQPFQMNPQMGYPPAGMMGGPPQGMPPPPFRMPPPFAMGTLSFLTLPSFHSSFVQHLPRLMQP